MHHRDKKTGDILREVPLQTSQFVADRVNTRPAPCCTVTKEKTHYPGSAPAASCWPANGAETQAPRAKPTATLSDTSSRQLLHVAGQEPDLYGVLTRQASPGQQFLSYTIHTPEISIPYNSGGVLQGNREPDG